MESNATNLFVVVSNVVIVEVIGSLEIRIQTYSRAKELISRTFFRLASMVEENMYVVWENAFNDLPFEFVRIQWHTEKVVPELSNCNDTSVH